MKLKIKKIVAREFLILLIIIVLGVISFLLTYLYNAFWDLKIEKTIIERREKTNIADSLSQSYSLKTENQIWLFNWVTAEFSFSNKEQKTKEEIWNRFDDLAKSDSIKIKWGIVWDKEIINFLKKIGFSTPDKFRDFIDQNRINKNDIENYNKSISLNSDVRNLRIKENKLNVKRLSFKEQFKFGINMTIAFMVVFGGGKIFIL